MISIFPRGLIPPPIPGPSFFNKRQPELVLVVAVGEKTYAPAVSDGGHGVVHVDVDPAACPPHPAVDHPHVNLHLLVDGPQCVVGYQLQAGNVCKTIGSNTSTGQLATK